MSGTLGINPSQLGQALLGPGGQTIAQAPSALANGNAGVNAQVPLGSLPPSLGLAPNANALQSGAPQLPWYAVPGMFAGTPAPRPGAAPGAVPGLAPAAPPVDPTAALLAQQQLANAGGGGGAGNN